MKRQRCVNNVSGVNPINPPPKVEDVAAKGKKKAKRDGTEQNVVKVEEESRVEVSGVLQGAGECVMGWNWEEYMPWLGNVVDEQMSWGTTWFPWWDIDFMGEAFNALLYSDVVWDYDIWNLYKEFPIPVPLDLKM